MTIKSTETIVPISMDSLLEKADLKDIQRLLASAKEVMVREVLADKNSKFNQEGDVSVLKQKFGTIDELFNFIQQGWIGMPATVVCKEIRRKDQFPHWEKCPKDHIYVGVIRRKKGDRVVMVRHGFSADLDCNVPAEELSIDDLLLTVWPGSRNLHCKYCGEFATSIDRDGSCSTCPTR
ncbi:hypothetical protein ACQKJG_17860 [Priestia megaterium]|uniref:hypothetical protein n=1 Tax=Priestia megaterium TaxID=1404 RepID=UPI003CFE7562